MSPSRPPRPPVPRPRPTPRVVTSRPADPAAPDGAVPGSTPARTAAPKPPAPQPAAPVPARTPPRSVSAAPGRGGPPSVAIRVPPVVSTTSAARFEERARMRRTLARRQAVGLVSAVVVLGALAWVLFFSPVLALDARELTIEIEGANSVVAADEVRAVVQARDETPLPRLDTGAIRQDVLDVPGVRDVAVSRDWPHGLTITIVAREPVAAVPADGRKGFTLLDVAGVQVGHVAKAPESLPVVDVPASDARTLGAVLDVVEQLPAPLAARVGSVSAQTQDTVSMKLRGGLRVDWGSSAQTPLKAAVLTTLLGSDAVEGAKVVDVSAPRMPIIE